jgi:hypothetical protein
LPGRLTDQSRFCTVPKNQQWCEGGAEGTL